MIDRKTRVQLVAFVLIAVLGVVYVAVRYIGIANRLGLTGYTVQVDLASAGGVFPNADVTYRGVSVGRVGGMHLTPTGIMVDLDIRSSRPIPKDVRAVVADGSVIGEQYVDLRPQTNSGPYLSDGSRIPRSRTALPPPVQDLLTSGERLAGSVPKQALNTVVNQIYIATDNASKEFGVLATTSRSFFTAAARTLPQTIALIEDGRTVLRTQQKTSESIRAFSRNLITINQQLRSSDGDISTVLRRASPALSQANGLFKHIDTPLHGLLTNLLSTSQILLANKGGLRQLYVNLPVAITDAGAVITPNGINTGLVPTFFDPLPCVAGYGGTQVRSGLDTSGDPGLNTAAGCTAPTSSGTDIRGSQHAP